MLEAKRVAEEERVKAEQAAEEARRAAEERERNWHELMDQAKERLIEAHRAKHLRAQADAWHEADRLRRYCDAIESAHGDDAETAQWIAWARSYADRLDPLTHPPKMPEPPEPTPEALQSISRKDGARTDRSTAISRGGSARIDTCARSRRRRTPAEIRTGKTTIRTRGATARSRYVLTEVPAKWILLALGGCRSSVRNRPNHGLIGS